jgi:hypothetical protein
MENIEIARLCIPGATLIEKEAGEHGEAITIDNIGIYRSPMKKRRIGGEMEWLGYEVMVFDHQGCEASSSEHFTFQEAILAAGIEWHRQQISRILDDISTDEYAKELEAERHLLEGGKS